GLPDAACTGQSKLLTTRQLPYFDQDGVHEIYREWRKILDSYPGERIGVAEAWVPSAERLARYLRPDELHQAFNFHFLEADWSASIFRGVIDESLEAVAGVNAPSTWVLSNHDVQRHVTRYGGGELGLRRARAAALLTLSLPGSVYVYQGEELGLPEVTDLPEEVLADPTWKRSGTPNGGATGVGCRCRGRVRNRRSVSVVQRGCRNHGTGPRSPSRPSNPIRDPLCRCTVRHCGSDAGFRRRSSRGATPRTRCWRSAEERRSS